MVAPVALLPERFSVYARFVPSAPVAALTEATVRAAVASLIVPSR